jgi:hypothetical protein
MVKIFAKIQGVSIGTQQYKKMFSSIINIFVSYYFIYLREKAFHNLILKKDVYINIG